MLVYTARSPGLFLHDVHAVIGEHEFDFEDAVRDEYVSAVAREGARLPGTSTPPTAPARPTSSPSTAVPDGATWSVSPTAAPRRPGGVAGQVDALRYG